MPRLPEDSIRILVCAQCGRETEPNTLDVERWMFCPFCGHRHGSAPKVKQSEVF